MKDNSLCGFGNIAHEFSHCLGLPDIYPLLSASGTFHKVLIPYPLQRRRQP
ncbi:MAG: hypothetical protein IKG81_14520 [Bacteroidales bacterium]|nr:hypothetical protein [Bacteroidales bacterium]